MAANAFTIVPFGYHDYVLTLSRSNAQLGIGAVLIVAGLLIAVALGLRRRQPMALALVASSALGVVVGTVSLSRTAGPAYLYFAVWLAYVPLSLLLAIGVALLAPRSSPPFDLRSTSSQTKARWGGTATRPVIVACVVAAVGLASVAVQSDLRMAPVAATTGAGPWPQGNAATPGREGADGTRHRRPHQSGSERAGPSRPVGQLHHRDPRAMAVRGRDGARAR